MRKKFIIPILIFAAVCGCILRPSGQVSATSCHDLEVVFVRGSGAPKDTNSDYLEFKSRLEEKLQPTSLDYNFTDLDYPAVGVPVNLLNLIGIYVSGGDAYSFGASVRDGGEKLINLVNNTSCPNTKFVLAGYSQGAMTITKILKDLDPNRIIYIATFGDPKLYLPEGAGIMPPACQGQELSSYRIYVPDCQAYQGLLGGIDPYEPAGFDGKLGTWCNKFDIFCSSYFSLTDHVSYIKDNLYEDAAKLILSKITKAFDIKNHYTSEHDTAILIDSTGSMGGLISQYKAEALRLAEKTLASNGRVALYDYRDLADNYQPYKHCDFETCTMEILQKELDGLEINGGGDSPESLLSASFHVMNELNWRLGATKSLVILTDADYHEPDLDGISMADVVQLSKNIDPVNFYVITKDHYPLIQLYKDLTEVTGGRVASTAEDLGILTDQIMERYDSLPRVEEGGFRGASPIKPVLSITNIETLEDGSVEINFKNTGSGAIVVLNDAILGLTHEDKLIIKDLRSGENNLVLIPITDTMRGDQVLLDLSPHIKIAPEIVIPKAPNTGRAI